MCFMKGVECLCVALLYMDLISTTHKLPHTPVVGVRHITPLIGPAYHTLQHVGDRGAVSRGNEYHRECLGYGMIQAGCTYDTSAISTCTKIDLGGAAMH